MKRGAVPYFNAAESSACSATPSMPRHRCARWARMERAPSPAVERARAGLAVDRHRLLAVASNPKIAAGSHEREKTRQRVACSPGRRSTCPVRLPVPVNTGRMTLVARARTPQTPARSRTRTRWRRELIADVRAKDTATRFASASAQQGPAVPLGATFAVAIAVCETNRIVLRGVRSPEDLGRVLRVGAGNRLSRPAVTVRLPLGIAIISHRPAHAGVALKWCANCSGIAT